MNIVELFTQKFNSANGLQVNVIQRQFELNIDSKKKKFKKEFFDEPQFKSIFGGSNSSKDHMKMRNYDGNWLKKF